ncbi:MAG: hypothetical protein RLZZ319_398 [Actinomycetota bacterium]
MNWSKIGVGALVAVVTALCVNWATDAFRVTNVLTDSMSPTIVAGDFVVTQNDSLRSPILGDIVMYDAKRLDGTVVARFTHRIVGETSDGWIVKGDANPDPDVQHPNSDDIQGVVIARIPGIGSIQPSWWPWAAGAGTLVFAGAYFVLNRKR